MCYTLDRYYRGMPKQKARNIISMMNSDSEYCVIFIGVSIVLIVWDSIVSTLIILIFLNLINDNLLLPFKAFYYLFMVPMPEWYLRRPRRQTVRPFLFKFGLWVSSHSTLSPYDNWNR